jgi:hypothetical protein
MTTSSQKHRSDLNAGHAAQDHVIDGLGQIRRHELQKGAADLQTGRHGPTAMRDRIQSVGPSWIACTVTKENQPLIR